MNRQPSPKISYAPMVLVVGAIVILVSGFLWFSPKQSSRSSVPAPESTPSTTTSPIVAPSKEISKEEPITVEDKKIEEKNREFEIVITYPSLKQGDVVVENINNTITSFVDTEIKQFKKEYLDAKKEGSTGNPDTPWSLTIDYNTPYQSKNIDSFELSINSYTGGAHPNATIKTIVVDLTKKTVLDLSDILKTNSSLRQLSVLVMSDLKQRATADNDWITNGAAARKENYTSWYLSSKGLTIVFPPYQVAAYTAGIQEVTVSFDQLKGIIKEEYFVQ